jgi:hypothetical protein
MILRSALLLLPLAAFAQTPDPQPPPESTAHCAHE